MCNLGRRVLFYQEVPGLFPQVGGLCFVFAVLPWLIVVFLFFCVFSKVDCYFVILLCSLLLFCFSFAQLAVIFDFFSAAWFGNGSSILAFTPAVALVQVDCNSWFCFFGTSSKKVQRGGDFFTVACGTYSYRGKVSFVKTYIPNWCFWWTTDGHVLVPAFYRSWIRCSAFWSFL